MLLEMIGPERIVGVGHDYYENGEVISPTMALTKDMRHEMDIYDEETILDTTPDLVLLYKANFGAYETLLPALEQAGIPYLFVDVPQDFEEVTASLTMLGDIVGAPEQTARMVRDFETKRARLAQIVSAIPKNERVRATYYRNYSPSSTFDVIAEAANVISDRGNVFVSKPYYQEIDDHLLSEWNPALIAFAPYSADTDGYVLDYSQDYVDGRTASLLEMPGLLAVSAIQNRNVHPLSIHNSQYMVQSAMDLAKLAYPHLFEGQEN